MFTPRLMYFYAFLSIIVMFMLAIYLEYWKGVTPCPLCVLQRIALAVIGVLFCFGFAFKLKKCGLILTGLLSFLFSSIGVLLAGRQVWIQHLPANQSPDCGVSLQYMLNILPWDEVIQRIFAGTAECFLVSWSFLGLSLAEWSLLWFIAFCFFTLWQTFRSKG